MSYVRVTGANYQHVIAGKLPRLAEVVAVHHPAWEILDTLEIAMLGTEKCALQTITWSKSAVQLLGRTAVI